MTTTLDQQAREAALDHGMWLAPDDDETNYQAFVAGYLRGYSDRGVEATTARDEYEKEIATLRARVADLEGMVPVEAVPMHEGGMGEGSAMSTIDQQAREAALDYEQRRIEFVCEHRVSTPVVVQLFSDGYLAAAEPREKEIAEARQMAADAIAMTADQENEIGRLSRRNSDMELTQREFGAFMHEKMEEIATLRARVAELEGMLSESTLYLDGSYANEADLESRISKALKPIPLPGAEG